MSNVCDRVVTVPQGLEVGEDSLQIVDSFRYLGDVISCGGEVELAVGDRISGAWSKWRELASLVVNHGIPLEERGKVYRACEVYRACIAVCCGNFGTNRKTERTAR